MSGGASGGTICVFSRSTCGIPGWLETQRITAPDAIPEGHYGSVSAISGNNMIIGVASRDKKRGVVFVLIRADESSN